MEIHVRELFAGKWMEDKSVDDVEDSLANGRSVGIVRVDLHANLADLRKEILQQISPDSEMPARFAFVEKLGKQLIEIWEKEEPILRVQDLVGREPEILIVERAANNQKPVKDQPREKDVKKAHRHRKGHKRLGGIEYPEPSRRRREDQQLEERYSADEARSRQLSRRLEPRFMLDDTDEHDANPSRAHRLDREPEKESNTKIGYEGTFQTEERPVRHLRGFDWQTREDIERNRPATVRIRREKSLTEELRFRGDDRPTIKNSIVKKSISIDDLRSPASDVNGFDTADSVAMDDYFLDRQPFSFSALNLRDLENKKLSKAKELFEPSKMERRIMGLLNRIRDVEEKISLLKNIGQEHWRGRFYQLRRITAPMEARVQQLEDEEDDIQGNLIRLFELRNPLTGHVAAVYGGTLNKSAYVIEVEKVQNLINQLSTQLENVDLDLMKYRKMRSIAESQNASLSRDINREKFLRHLLLDRSFQS
ncbi:hypothetical protein BV898_10372 [Hypsibius exemplaris]|uniref:Spermatogenesis-associated protein 1 C-terminal domain-containing protein n=1 Tax=Hypsibius exemplaris TaxID=2072580 RepID=A0A1W0WJY1_HYPEX|nr:hypothetical protein BV898_10372 [Hypsibius exemplaris]